MAARGSRIIVQDRDEPVAQLGPVDKALLPWRERLAQEGRLRLGTQDWGKLKISKIRKRIDSQSALAAVREDPNEVRRH